MATPERDDRVADDAFVRPRSYRVPQAKIDAYLRLRRRGANIRQACREAGISPSTAYKIEDTQPAGLTTQGRATGTLSGRRAIADEDIPPPLGEGDLSPAARRALEDFPYFRQRYFGRISVPWQEDAADRMLRYLESPWKEYVVVNVAPGVGKTTLFCHDLPCWLTVRDRRLRTMQGSRVKDLATRNTNRIRRSLSRQSIAAPDEDSLRRGLATMPSGILCEDYGRFSPEKRGDDLWRADGFVVVQLDGEVITDKELSMEAFGFDAEFLGNRFPLVIWDDLVSKSNIRTETAREKLSQEYEEEAEARLEPGGLMILQGQRRAAHDLYAHCLRQYVPVLWDSDDDHEIDRPASDPPEGEPCGAVDQSQGNPWLSDEEVAQDRDAVLLAPEGEVRGYRPKYHHVVYPAHYDDRCAGEHDHRTARAALASDGDGCLLDPQRLPFRELVAHRSQNPTKYRILYQQESIDPRNVTVQQIWVDGGVDDETGESFPGCWDFARPAARRGEPATMPADAPATAKSVACLDPSGSRFWAYQWWLWEPATFVHWLCNAVRKPLAAPELLDWNAATQRFSGLLEDQWHLSDSVGRPFRWLIGEVNVCQKWLYQYDHAQRWLRLRGVTLVPHTTGRNKADEEKGVETIGPHYRYGRTRLPGAPAGRPVSDLLVAEATVHPEGMTDDQVMAHWFLTLNAPRLFPRSEGKPTLLRRPSWLAPDTPPDNPLLKHFVRSA